MNDIIGKAQLKDDAKCETSESGAGAGKRNHTDVSIRLPVAVSPEKEVQRPPAGKAATARLLGRGQSC